MKKNYNKTKDANLSRRHVRVRAKIFGTAKIPRLCVTRSLKYVFLQLVDDEHGRTLASVHSKSLETTGKKTDLALAAGQRLAELAGKAGITKCVFDRGGRQYHGRVKAVADGARAGGLQF